MASWSIINHPEQKGPKMNVSDAIKTFLGYQRLNSQKNTIRNYEHTLNCFRKRFGDREIDFITTDDIPHPTSLTR